MNSLTVNGYPGGCQRGRAGCAGHRGCSIWVGTVAKHPGTTRPRSARQLTQGMPLSALTAPPWAPLVGIGTGTAGVEAAGVPEAVGSVASAPSMTSTWPAATEELAVAVTPNSEAIWAALAAEPEP